MTFTELALLIWAIAASVVATHYWARHGSTLTSPLSLSVVVVSL